MIIFAPSRPPVKPARRTARSAGRFGSGILATRPTFRADHTLDDEAWYVAQRFAAVDRHIDRLAGEAMAQSRLEAGLLF